MCFTGGFALAMAADERIVAPVLSQPSLPFGATAGQRSTIDISGEDLDTVKITPPHVRLKLWYLLQEMLEESAHEVGGKFIPVLAEAQDEAGYLRPEYWYHDVTHANRLYGGLMLRRVIEELG